MVRYQPLNLEDPIVVTGGGGFIGSNLVRRLVELGHQVHVVDPHPRERLLRDVSYLEVPLGLLGAGTNGRRARTVIHLAADMGGVGYFHSDADFGASLHNTETDIFLLRWVAETGARTFVASSACAYPIEYQQLEGCPYRLDEENVGQGTPDQLYGAAKLHLLRMAGKLSNVRVGILHTVYGPLCEREGPRMKFPAAVATKALRARETGVLELWGNGRQMRSYLYVDDAVDRILQLTDDDDYIGPVNVGYEGAVTCREVAELCLELAGAPDATIHLNLAEPSGVLARDCDNTLWRQRYGATDDVSPQDGFARLLDWLETT